MNMKSQYDLKNSLVLIISFVALGRFSGSQKNEVRVGITLTMRIVTQAAIPTTRRAGYVIAPLILRVIESTFSV